MSRSAGIPSQAKARTIAVLLSALALGACSSQNDVMAEKVAAAEAAAAKAIAAQQAAEKAAATLASAPPRVEPTVMADTPSTFNDDHDEGDTDDGSAMGNDLSPNGNETNADGIPVIPNGA